MVVLNHGGLHRQKKENHLKQIQASIGGGIFWVFQAI